MASPVCGASKYNSFNSVAKQIFIFSTFLSDINMSSEAKQQEAEKMIASIIEECDVIDHQMRDLDIRMKMRVYTRFD
jgi:hypothetical protein